MAEFSVQAEIKVLTDNTLIWSSGSFSKLIPVIERNHSLEVMVLKSCFFALSSSQNWGLLSAPGDHCHVHRGCLQGRNYARLAYSNVPGLCSD